MADDQVPTTASAPEMEAVSTPPSRPARAIRWQLLLLIGAFAAAGIALRLANDGGLDQTGVLFVGVPTVLALGLARSTPARTAYGRVLFGTTLGLVLAMTLLGEGFVCVLMAAPLVYATVLAVAALIHRFRRPDGDNRLSGLAIIPLAALCIEGLGPVNLAQRDTATSTRVVEAPAAAVRAALASAPHFEHRAPFFLRLGFPEPHQGLGSGLAVGDLRSITFDGDAMTMPNPRGAVRMMPNSVVIQVSDAGPDHVTFTALDNTTMINRWAEWKTMSFSWQAVDDGHTTVTVTIVYNRLLAPAVYFGPLEHYGHSVAADYSIDAFATPVR